MSVYFAQQKRGGLIKIGYSANVKERLRAVGAKHLLGAIRGGREVEGRTHKRFTHLRVHGEWFRPGNDLLEFIQTKAQSETPDEEVKQTGIRLPSNLISRVEEFQRKIQDKTRIKMNFSMALRSLVERGLRASSLLDKEFAAASNSKAKKP